MASSAIQPDEQSPREESLRSIVYSIKEMNRFRYSRYARHLVTVTAAYDIETEEDRVVLADATAGALNVTLPAAANADETEYVIKKVDVSVNAVTLVTPGAETIDGAATFVLTSQFDAVRVASDGTNYCVTGSYP